MTSTITSNTTGPTNVYITIPGRSGAAEVLGEANVES